ncbi:hypothetical protein CFP56_025502 [Quercus suber]|uniref:Uncharacterized protein n=1 Tax=Quercus suber TaxID=58331 RepID=A0AAW0LXF1_QUESU|nr:hypothetical protein CFP56_44107 [Quercus suber]
MTENQMTGALRDLPRTLCGQASPITMNWSLPSKSVSACVYLAFLNPLVILIISRSIPYYKQRFLIVLSSPSQMKHKLQLL